MRVTPSKHTPAHVAWNRTVFCLELGSASSVVHVLAPGLNEALTALLGADLVMSRGRAR